MPAFSICTKKSYKTLITFYSNNIKISPSFVYRQDGTNELSSMRLKV